jgi:hypothetical protein
MELFEILIREMLNSGPIGLLAAIGWALSGFMLYREFKKRDSVAPEIKEKNDIIEKNEKTIKEKDEVILALNKDLLFQAQSNSTERIADLKELVSDYNDVVSDVNHTLEKLSVSLHVKISE